LWTRPSKIYASRLVPINAPVLTGLATFRLVGNPEAIHGSYLLLAEAKRSPNLPIADGFSSPPASVPAPQGRRPASYPGNRHLVFVAPLSSRLYCLTSADGMPANPISRAGSIEMRSFDVKSRPSFDARRPLVTPRGPVLTCVLAFSFPCHRCEPRSVITTLAPGLLFLEMRRNT
jgi:hypothetical protein